MREGVAHGCLEEILLLASLIDVLRRSAVVRLRRQTRVMDGLSIVSALIRLQSLLLWVRCVMRLNRRRNIAGSERGTWQRYCFDVLFEYYVSRSILHYSTGFAYIGWEESCPLLRIALYKAFAPVFVFARF